MGLILATRQREAREEEEVEAAILRYCRDNDPEPWIQQALHAADPPPKPPPSEEKGSSPSKSEASTAPSEHDGDEEDGEEHPVFDALRRGKAEEAKEILLANAACEAQDAMGDTALHKAAEFGMDDLCRWLGRRHGEFEVQNHLGWTPLMTAVFHAQLACVESLMDGGAKRDVVDVGGRTCLHLAAAGPKIYHLELMTTKMRDKRRGRRKKEFEKAQENAAQKSNKVKSIRKMMERNKKIGELTGMSALRAQLKKAVADQGLSSGVDYNKMNFGTVQSEADKLAWGEIGRHFKEYWQHAPNRIEVILLARLFGDPYVKRSGKMSSGHKVQLPTNAKDDRGRTALHWACQGGLREYSSRLMHSFANLEAEDLKMNRPLHYAVQSGNIELVEMILACKADVNATNHVFSTPLHLAVDRRDAINMKLLCKFKADTGAYNADGLTPVLSAMRQADPHMFKGILKMDPCLDAIDTRGWNLAVYAVRHNLLKEVVEHLTAKGLTQDICYALLHFQDPQGWTALHHAVIMQSERWVEKICEMDTAFDYQDRSTLARDANGNTPLHLAAQYGSMVIVDMICREVESVDMYNNFNETALLIAAKAGNTAVVLSLLDHRKNIMPADSRVDDIWGRGVLHHAAVSGNLDMLNILMVQRKELNSRFAFSYFELNKGDKDGCSPAMLAAAEGQWKVISSLVLSQASLTTKDKDGWSALHYAANAGEDLATMTLLDCRAEVDAVDDKGWSALMHAVDQGYHTTAAVLLDGKADLKIVNHNADTILTMAGRGGKRLKECMELLVDRMRDLDSHIGRPMNSLDTVPCEGHLVVTLKSCDHLYLEGLPEHDLNTYVVMIMTQRGISEYSYSACDLANVNPRYFETCRFDLPVIDTSCRLIMLVMATFGDRNEIKERMKNFIGKAISTAKKKNDAEMKKTNAILKKFSKLTSKAAAVKAKELEEKKKQQLDENGLEQESLAPRRWAHISTIWRSAGLQEEMFPALPPEDTPIGFVVVNPSLLKESQRTCEIGDPISLERALRGTPRGSIAFEIDYRRHFSPDNPPVVVPPVPPAHYLDECPKAPLESYKEYPTVPWGAQIPPRRFETVEDKIAYGEYEKRKKAEEAEESPEDSDELDEEGKEKSSKKKSKSSKRKGSKKRSKNAVTKI
jgi:ankyrin repeat protein